MRAPRHSLWFLSRNTSTYLVFALSKCVDTKSSNHIEIVGKCSLEIVTETRSLHRSDLHNVATAFIFPLADFYFEKHRTLTV